MTKYFVDADGAYIGGFDGKNVELPPDGIEVETAPENAHDRWVNGAWVKIPVVPEFVPMLNAELVLIGAGYWDDVQDFVSQRGPYALAFLRRAQTMRRDNVLVNAWAAARGVTDAQLDALFIAADNLKVDEFHG